MSKVGEGTLLFARCFGLLSGLRDADVQLFKLLSLGDLLRSLLIVLLFFCIGFGFDGSSSLGHDK